MPVYDLENAKKEFAQAVENLKDKKFPTNVVLYYYDEFSVKEISEMLNIPEGTVKSRLARARDKIYEILKMEEGERIG